MNGPDLRGVVDFGNISASSPSRSSSGLRWMHDHIVANWGWSIIILTIIINLVLLPLRLTSMKLGAEDAEDPAADEGAAGEIQEIQDERSEARRNEHRDGGALQRTRREPGGRMLAAGDPDAVPDRVLRHAGGRDRAAAGALVLAARSIVARQVVRHPGLDPDQHRHHAAHDAAGRAWIRRRRR